MFELDARHIAALSDEHLRILIGKLAERHLRDTGLPESAVTYGGDQRAADGGVDVRVDLPTTALVSGWVPRPRTVFQVKQEKAGFPPSAVTAEMCPKGKPRPVLSELAAERGAYILVSGGESPSDKGLRNRRRAMRDAVAGQTGATDLELDFYGGDRVARWTNLHPGLVLWVREQIGEPLSGWQPYTDWSATPQPIDSEYLVDEKGRLFDDSVSRSDGLPIIDGIGRIRAKLSQPGTAVRLVGLSGMGKTRLVQALFDSRVGADALDPKLAVYADVGMELDPSPQRLLARLAREGVRAVMVVDNCPPPLHAILAKGLNTVGAKLSLITVEYDVGDDEPQDAAVFRLEPASDAIIERLIERAHPHVTGPDRQHIAELTDGNARLALALAATIGRGDSVARLSRRELFERLFYQRQEKDSALLRAAEACALVYSFDGETMEGEGAELPTLAELAGQTVSEFHRHVAELKRRQLVQHRERWRAVLPQALAIHLARAALENIPVATICKVMAERAPVRLFRSFTRRLGYLHDSEEARRIVTAWLSPGGRLSDAVRSVENRWSMSLDPTFVNVAPVCPELALAAIQLAADREGDDAFFAVNRYCRSELVDLLHQLSYDAEMFECAALLMIRALATEAPDNNHYSASGHVRALFWPYLSGTRACQIQRFGLIDRLLAAPEPRLNDIGLMALGAMLNAGHFSSVHQFTFGARPRDYGWSPRTVEEQAEWYRAALNRVVALASPDSRWSKQARAMLASNFRSLWSVPLLAGDVEAAARIIAGQAFWPDGWGAVCKTIAFDSTKMPTDALMALRALEQVLRPADPVQKVRAYVLSGPRGAFDITIAESMGDPHQMAAARLRIEDEVRAFGQFLAMQVDVLDGLLPDLLTEQGEFVSVFGKGLGETVTDIDAMWRRLVSAFAAIADNRRNLALLNSFFGVASERDAVWAGNILDEAVTDPLLGPVFPLLQTAVDIDGAGVERLLWALATGLAPIGLYRLLGYGGSKGALPDDAFVSLVSAVSAQPGGYSVAIEAISLHVHSVERTSGGAVSPTLIAFGRALLARCELSGQDDDTDYHLAKVIKTCLVDPDATDAARTLCRNIAAVVGRLPGHYSSFGDAIGALASLQPAAFLDVFVDAATDADANGLIKLSRHQSPNLLRAAPHDVLFEWADVDPSRRYPRLAGFLGLFPADSNAETPKEEEHAALAAALIDRAPEKAAVLTAFAESLHPTTWSGNLSDLLEGRRQNLPALLRHHVDDTVRHWACETDRRLAAWAESEREREQTRDRREQSFE